MKKLLLTLCLVLGLSGPAWAQFATPYTFSPNTRAQSAQVNANFSLLANALDRRAGVMSGDLTVLDVFAAANDTYVLGASGTRFANVFAVLGNFSGNVTVGTLNTFTFDQSVASGASPTFGAITATTLNTYTFNQPVNIGASPSLLGINITGLVEANITDGAILARVAANETVSGAWTFSQTLSMLGAAVTPPSSVGGLHLRAINAGTTGVELHIRPASGKKGYVTFTEDSVADRWAIGIENGDGALYVRSGSTTGTARMTLSAAGALQAGAQPGFLAYKNTNSTGVINTATLIPDVVMHNTGNHYNATTGIFTAPVAGVYYFSGSAALMADSSSTVYGVRLTFGGSTSAAFVLGQIDTDAVFETQSVGNGLYMSLAAGDTARLTLISSDSTVTVVGGALTWFSGRLMP